MLRQERELGQGAIRRFRWPDSTRMVVLGQGVYEPVHPHAFPVVRLLAATHHTPGKMVLSEP